MQQNTYYNLEDRTLKFAKDIRVLVKIIPRTLSNIEDSKQLIRSSGSIGANYREANDSFSKKDFRMRIMICRKEAKESIFWLELLEIIDKDMISMKLILKNEADQLMKIFGAILAKTKE